MALTLDMIFKPCAECGESSAKLTRCGAMIHVMQLGAARALYEAAKISAELGASEVQEAINVLLEQYQNGDYCYPGDASTSV